ncbi:hypothetical protein EJ110_NYTH22458 [Nymphaea thermarum]|nr:hypothetical protein EJ110_NYTH22458 [Nymphaea thermarum]
MKDGKPKERKRDSPAIGSSSSLNVDEGDVSKSSTIPGEIYASKEQPLWKEMKAVIKDVGSGGGNVHFVCKYCEGTFVESYTRIKAHLLKLSGHGIRGCKKFSTEKAQEFKRLQDRADAIHNKKKTRAPGRVTPNLDNELNDQRMSCMDRLFTNSYTRKQAICEYNKFFLRNFSSEGAAAAREDDNMSSFDWWASYGSEMPVLHKLALWLLSQPVTSLCSERNWSIYVIYTTLKGTSSLANMQRT